MGAVHQWLAFLALAVSVAGVVLALASTLAPRLVPVRIVDRLALFGLAAFGPVLLTGAAMALFEGLPRDPLHLVYAVAVFAPLPLGQYLGRGGSPRQRAGYLALGAFVTVGLILRLFQTGG
jgi:hypothetical protein